VFVMAQAPKKRANPHDTTATALNVGDELLKP
jgi:hypothetical protein